MSIDEILDKIGYLNYIVHDIDVAQYRNIVYPQYYKHPVKTQQI
jgi:hypothetical protein